MGDDLAKKAAREELLRKLRSIAASANDARDYLHDIESLGGYLDDMMNDLERARGLAERI